MGIPRTILAAIGLGASVVLAGCAASPPPSAAGPSPNGTPSSSAGSGSETPTPAPTAGPVGGAFGNVLTACLGLGEDDCRRVAGHVAAVATSADPRVRYVQIGPFGCAAGEGCASTLLARPEGDVVIETASGALGFHVTAVGDAVTVRAMEIFGISLAPSSAVPLPLIPQPFSLGHCGLWSGVDVGGSWWDPVGLIDSDHGDAINAADGTFAPVGPDRATFTSNGGFVVQLVRRDGDKFLPFCQ